MFLVKDHALNNLVFTWEDPRKDGYSGEVETGVSLDYDWEKVHTWHDGEPRPQACVGVASDDPKKYKVFKFESDRQREGYQAVSGKARVFGSWAEYALLRNFAGKGENYLHYEFEAGPDDVLRVTLFGRANVPLEGHANVLLFDDANFQKYQTGQPYIYADGGFAAKPVVHLYPPMEGHWHVVIDLGGYSGHVRAAVEQLSGQQIVG